MNETEREDYSGSGKIKYMKEAIRQARKAELLNEVPIGCVIVYRIKLLPAGTTGGI